jgi:release factor glutamine methyltransferase
LSLYAVRTTTNPTQAIPRHGAPNTSDQHGRDGRHVLDPLCQRAPDLLAEGGTIFIVHSEFADVDRTVEDLRGGGLYTRVVAEQVIPFGPVLTARARWLERVGLLDAGRREERLAVIRADKS